MKDRKREHAPSAKPPRLQLGQQGQLHRRGLVRLDHPQRATLSPQRDIVPRHAPCAHELTPSSLRQTLFVTEGIGRIQIRGESEEEIRAGDVVIKADEWYWNAPGNPAPRQIIAETILIRCKTYWVLDNLLS